MLNIVYSNDIDFVFKNENSYKIIMVPELFSHNYQRLLCEKIGNTASENMEISSFEKITTKIFSEIGGLSRTYIDDNGRILALFNAISKTFDNLTVYKNNKYDNEILAIIDEFKLYDITETQLLESVKNIDGSLKNKLLDLYYIYSEYNKITEYDLNDPRDEIEYLCDNFNKSTIIDDAKIYFIKYDGFTPRQYKLILEMLKKNIDVTMVLDVRKRNDKIHDLFCVERDTDKRLKKLCKINNIECKTSFMQNKVEKFDEIAQRLFDYTEEKNAQNNDIFLHISETAQQECLYVASKIIDLIRSGKYRFRDILVTSRNFSSYKKYLEIALNRYEIPYFYADTEKICNKLPIKVISDTLNILNSDFSTKSVFKYIKSPLSHINKQQSDILEDYTLRWGIEFLGENVKLTSNPSFRLRKMNDDELLELAKINEIKKIALAPIYKLQKSFKKATKGSDFVEILYKFIEDINLQANINAYIENLKNVKEKQQYLQIWDKIIDCIDQFYEICGNQEMSLDEFIKLFTVIIENYEVSAIPSSIDNVYMGDFEKIVGENCKILFILGAENGNLPQKITENIILNDTDREILEQNEIYLSPFGVDLIARENALIYKIFALPQDKIFVSIPEITVSGEISAPSKIFDILRKNTKKFSTDRQISNNFMVNSKKTYLEYMFLYKKFDNISKSLTSELLQKANKKYDILSKETIDKIYKKSISPSRVDTFNSCRFLYFLRYGLMLDERKVIKFDRLENGNFIHYVLENILKKQDYSKKNNDKYIAECIEDYTREFFSENMQNDARFSYYFDNLKLNTAKIVQNIIDEINASEFKPCDFEIEINNYSEVKPLKIQDFNIIGKVDRVDIYREDNDVFLRVVDYKSGVKKLDLTTFNHGINMQMMIYMIILNSSGYYKKNSENLYAKGMLYIPTKLPQITSADAIYGQTRENEIIAALKRSGLLTDDKEIIRKMEKNDPFLYLPVGFTAKNEFKKSSSVASEVRFEAIEGLMMKNLEKTILGIKSGDISANPYEYDKKSPCDYCKFTDCCSFCNDYDEKIKFSKMTNEEFFENLGV